MSKMPEAERVDRRERQARGRARARARTRDQQASTRRERQARTRAQLIASAAMLLSERGLDRTTIDDIAADAGYTKGAFYSNFSSKEDMFLAILDIAFDREVERLERELSADVPPAAQVPELGEDFVRQLGSDAPSQRMLFEFIARASRNEPFRRRLKSRYSDLAERIAALYRRRFPDLERPGTPAWDDVVLMTFCMAQGFFAQRLIDPELDESLYRSMLETFFAGLTERGEARR